jgi:LmbE family N-acetylglucosaminyl deacetylase
MKLDVLAIGVHPDDVELGCSGTLINEVKRGKTVGIVDLTEGELGTRGSVETRYKEAADAAVIIGAAARENLKMRDGFF